MNDTERENISEINDLRAAISSFISDAKSLEPIVGVPAVQEIVIARRHLEDARMRLGVARTILEGNDPYKS